MLLQSVSNFSIEILLSTPSTISTSTISTSWPSSPARSVTAPLALSTISLARARTFVPTSPLHTHPLFCNRGWPCISETGYSSASSSSSSRNTDRKAVATAVQSSSISAFNALASLLTAQPIDPSVFKFNYTQLQNQQQQQQQKQQQRRHRTIFSGEQLQMLETAFRLMPYPDVRMREQLADRCALRVERVEVWFKNRRAKARKRAKEDDSLN